MNAREAVAWLMALPPDAQVEITVRVGAASPLPARERSVQSGAQRTARWRARRSNDPFRLCVAVLDGSFGAEAQFAATRALDGVSAGFEARVRAAALGDEQCRLDLGASESAMSTLRKIVSVHQ